MSAPATPADVALTAKGANGDVRFDWSAVSDVASYHYELRRAGVLLYSGFIAAPATRLITDYLGGVSLGQGTAWQLALSSFGFGGESTPTTVDFTTSTNATLLSDVPSPTGLAVGSITANTALLTWSDTSTQSAYYEFALLANGHETVFTGSGGTASVERSFGLTGLLANTAYSVRIRFRTELAGVDYRSRVLETGPWSPPVPFTTGAGPYTLTTPAEISAQVNATLGYNFAVTGITADLALAAQDFPPGVTLTPGGFSTDHKPFSLGGIPTLAGLFDSSIQVNQGGALSYVPLRWLVSGGGFLGAFQSYPDNRDIVVDSRQGTVTGYYFESGALRIDLGSDCLAFLIFTDMGRYISTDVTAVRLTARQENNLDSPPMLDVTAPPTVTYFGTVPAFPIPFRCDSRLLRACFAALNAGPTGGEDSLTIRLTARVEWSRAGVSRRSRPFTLIIAQ